MTQSRITLSVTKSRLGAVSSSRWVVDPGFHSRKNCATGPGFGYSSILSEFSIQSPFCGVVLLVGAEEKIVERSGILEVPSGKYV